MPRSWPCSWAWLWRSLLGFIDDRWQIRARWQLLGQLLLAGIALIGGITFVQIANPFQFLGEAFGDRNLDLTFKVLQFDLAIPSSSRCPSCSPPSGSWA